MNISITTWLHVSLGLTQLSPPGDWRQGITLALCCVCECIKAGSVYSFIYWDIYLKCLEMLFRLLHSPWWWRTLRLGVILISNVSSKGLLWTVSLLCTIMWCAWGHTLFVPTVWLGENQKCERIANRFFFFFVNGTRVPTSAPCSWSTKLEQTTDGEMLRWRCLSQCVPWHFGQLIDSLLGCL